jgi:glyoxylase I family protein
MTERCNHGPWSVSIDWRAHWKKEEMMWQRRQLLRALSLAFGVSFISRPGRGLMKDVAAAGHEPTGGTAMEKVSGIGGLFFRAHDPTMLARWYEQHLGILLTPTSYGDPAWQQEAGPTVFAPFEEKSEYFGDAQKVWMVNFRVHDLDKMAKQLTDAGIAVKIDPKIYPNGRFARLHDPEGNPIELWQASVPKPKA